MRLIILTTQTLHHAYFVRKLANRFPLSAVFIESDVLPPPYETAHSFELERDNYEKETWFGGEEPCIDKIAECRNFPSLDSSAAVSAMKDMRADLGIVFGTRRLRGEAMKVCPTLLNLHGGDPELYRGLDTHLWAIWHRDFSSLVTCLHHIAPRLDTGNIVSKAPVRLRQGMKLSQLRAANTETCLELTCRAAAAYEADGAVDSIPQRVEGRYYSFMPVALKTVCLDVFERYCRGLTESGNS
jgi:hypothetical protein